MSASMQQAGMRTRVPSHHMRELVRGQFMVLKRDIAILDCIGEGFVKHCYII